MSAVTVEDLESELVSRASDMMLLLGMSIAVDGSNPDLRGPLAFGGRNIGLTLASPMTLSDSDMASLDDADLDGMLDFSELRLLENMSNRFTLSTAKVGSLAMVAYSDVMAGLQKRIAALTKKLQDLYGYQQGSLEVGMIGLDFTEEPIDV